MGGSDATRMSAGHDGPNKQDWSRQKQKRDVKITLFWVLLGAPGRAGLVSR